MEISNSRETQDQISLKRKNLSQDDSIYQDTIRKKIHKNEEST